MATVEVRGLPELLRKLDANRLAGKPARNLLNRWRLFTEAEAKRGAPVWRGQLRRSITSEIDDGPLPRSARVGTNAPEAKPTEYGTGLLSDAPDSKHRRYRPPGAALEPWARSHGFLSGEEVAHIIYKKGGTKPKRYLRNAAEASEKQLPVFVGLMAREIESQAGNG